MGETRLCRRIVFDGAVPVDVPLAAIDLDLIRRGYSALFDRAAQAVQAAGYEQDNSVVDRFLVCRAGNETDRQIAAEWLSDAKLLTMQIVGTLTATGVAEVDARAAHIISLKAVATLETTA